MSLVFGAICPHPPIIIPSIGQENLKEVQKTIKALLELEKKLIQAQPETILVISPHGPIEPNSFNILGEESLSGSFYQFGDWKTEMYFRNDLDLANRIKEEANKNNLPVKIIPSNELDHGMMVPLFYLTSGKLDNLPIVGMGFSFLPLETHFSLGRIIQQAIKKSQKKVAIVASGDLSHRLSPDAPAGYSKMGKIFDRQLINLIKEKNVTGLLKMDHRLIEEAGECGLRSIVMLLGALEGLEWQPEILSYEGPFGVGYLVAHFKIKKL